MIKGKKGKGHVEAIISFVIFIGFVTFLFTIFNPFSSPENTGLVDLVFLNMEESLGIELRSISININDSDAPVDCFSINYIDQLNCLGNNILVKNSSGAQVGAELLDLGDEINIERTTDDFYTIHCAPELTQQPITNSCTSFSEGTGEDQYVLGILSKKKLWFENNFTLFSDRYDTDYEGLRSELIPQGSDFGFSVWNLNDLSGEPLFHGENSLSSGRAVDAKTVGIDVLDVNANIIKRTINIRVY